MAASTTCSRAGLTMTDQPLLKWTEEPFMAWTQMGHGKSTFLNCTEYWEFWDGHHLFTMNQIDGIWLLQVQSFASHGGASAEVEMGPFDERGEAILEALNFWNEMNKLDQA